jgi:hypothetical protein
MEEKIKKIKDFLSRFDNPILKFLPDKSAPGAISNINLNRNIEEYIVLNEQYPC